MNPTTCPSRDSGVTVRPSSGSGRMGSPRAFNEAVTRDVRHLERGVSHRPRQSVSQALRRRHTQPDHQVGHVDAP